MKGFIVLHKTHDSNVQEVHVAIAHIIMFWRNDTGSYVSMAEDHYLYAQESPDQIALAIANATYP